jgi:regulator of ribonuclease activity A
VASKRKAGRPVGETIGGILVGFDYQILRTTPPPHELVQKAAPVRGLSGEDGSELTVSFPEPPPTALPPATGQGWVSTTDTADAEPAGLQVCELQFQVHGARRRFAGRIRTVRCWQDNVLIRRVLEERVDGQVLVVDGGGSFATALLGDNVAGLAASNGWAGIVVNGCIRDSDAVDQLPIGVRSLGVNPRRSAKTGAGEVDVPVSFGAATFTPGAWLISDEDGIVVLTAEPSPA